MPSRLMSLLILVYWSIAAFCLLKWDVLPELSTGYPPDLRGIAFASQSDRPVKWNIQVLDGRRTEDRRIVGEAVTTATRQPDGWYTMTADVELDAGDLLRGTLLAMRESLRVQVKSRYHIDPMGNLQNFDVRLRPKDFGDELVHVTGRLREGKLEVVTRGPLPILNNTYSLKYEPRGVVSDVLGPLDRLPGLHVGQRWEMQVVNPVSGRVEPVKAEVTRRTVIQWAGIPEMTYEVVQKTSSMQVRTWVRPDGVILRQEVPFPLVRLILERQGDNISPQPEWESSATAGRPSP